MDAVETGLQQQAQGAGAAALLQRIAAAFQPSDLPLQPGLFLLQSRSGALLDRQGVCGLLQRLFSGREALEQGLPVLLQLLQSLLHRLLVVAVLLLLLLQFRQPFRVLPQPLLQLLLFLQQRCQGDLQLLATAAASFLLLQPGTGAAGYITEAPPGDLHRCFRPPTSGLGSSQSVLMGILLKLAGLVQPVLAAVGQVMAQPLQPLSFLLMAASLPFQFPSAGLQAFQLGLNRQQLIFPQSFHLLLQGLQFGAGLAEALLAAGDCRIIALLLGFKGLLTAGQIFERLAGRFEGQHHLLTAAQLQPFPQLLVLPGLGAVFFQALATGQQFLFDDPAAVLPLLHVVELAAGLLDAAVEQGNTGQFVDEAAAVAVAHRDDAGHIALHHHIAAFGVDA